MLLLPPENPSAELLGGGFAIAARNVPKCASAGGASVGAARKEPPVEKSGKRGSQAKLRVSKSMSINFVRR